MTSPWLGVTVDALLFGLTVVGLWWAVNLVWPHGDYSALQVAGIIWFVMSYGYLNGIRMQRKGKGL